MKLIEFEMLADASSSMHDCSPLCDDEPEGQNEHF